MESFDKGLAVFGALALACVAGAYNDGAAPIVPDLDVTQPAEVGPPPDQSIGTARPLCCPECKCDTCACTSKCECQDKSQAVAIQPPAPPAPPAPPPPASGGVYTQPKVMRPWYQRQGNTWVYMGTFPTDPSLPTINVQPVQPRPAVQYQPQPMRGLFGRPIYRGSCGPNGCP